MVQVKSGAPRGNKNRKGKKSVERERIPINMSISEKNGLLGLSVEYLSRQGIDPSDDNIREMASDWFYLHYGTWLKREIEIDDAAIIV